MIEWFWLAFVLIGFTALEVLHLIRIKDIRDSYGALLEAERRDRKDLMDRIQAKDFNEYKRHVPPVVMTPVQDKDKDVITPL